MTRFRYIVADCSRPVTWFGYGWADGLALREWVACFDGHCWALDVLVTTTEATR